MVNRKSSNAMFVQHGSIKKRNADCEKQKPKKKKRNTINKVTWEKSEVYFSELEEKRKVNFQKNKEKKIKKRDEAKLTLVRKVLLHEKKSITKKNIEKLLDLKFGVLRSRLSL